MNFPAHALRVAFHGYGAEYDQQLNRPGAPGETCLAVRRAQECVLSTDPRPARRRKRR